jgi:hypothetical protein
VNNFLPEEALGYSFKLINNNITLKVACRGSKYGGALRRAHQGLQIVGPINSFTNTKKKYTLNARYYTTWTETPRRGPANPAFCLKLPALYS